MGGEKLRNTIFETIKFINDCSGAFTDNELLDACLTFCSYNHDISEEDITDLFNDDFDNIIMDKLEGCKTPPMRFIHVLNTEDLDRILSEFELNNSEDQEELVKNDIYEREIKELGLEFSKYNIDREDPFEALVEDKISGLVENRRKEIEEVIKKNRNKRQKLNNFKEVNTLYVIKSISKNIVLNKQKKWYLFK